MLVVFIIIQSLGETKNMQASPLLRCFWPRLAKWITKETIMAFYFSCCVMVDTAE